MAGAGHLPSFKAFAKRVEDRPSRPAVRQPDVGGLGAGSRSGAAPPRPRAHSGDRLGGATEDELAIWMRDATSGLTLRPRGTVDAPKAARIALAATSAIALADGSIVTLALPQLRGALDTGVEGVAAVLVIYCAALAVALALAIPLARRWGVARVGIAGLTLLAAGSLLCAAAGSLPVLLAARTVQAAGAAAALLLSFSYLREQPHLWRQTALLGTAVGPALGGALTQAFSWPSIFLFQAPIAIGAALLCLPLALAESAAGSPAPAPAPARGGAPRGRQTQVLLALAATAASLSAVLFLLVLLLVAGGGVSPLRAAAELLPLPVTALVAARAPGRAASRAAVGCVALGAGVLMLAALPRPAIAWLLVPEMLSGTGLGLALPALAGELLPEESLADAARVLITRFGGIALTLLVLAPLISARLQHATDRARLQGAAALIQSPLSPEVKLSLAPALASSMEKDNPRRALALTVARARPGLAAGDRRALAQLQRTGDAIVFEAVDGGLRDAFLVSGVLALVAAIALAVPRRRVAGLAATSVATIGVAGGALALTGVYAIAAATFRPATPAVGAACRPTGLPTSPGLAGLLQDAAVGALDEIACARHVSREQLLLQLAAAVHG